MARSGRVCCLLLLAVLCAGCGESVIRRAGGPDLLNAWKASTVGESTLSARTRQTLRRWDLEEVYARQPDEATSALHQTAVVDPQPDILFALAEIHYVRGRALEKWSCDDAIGFYYFCAGYAWHYLFAVCQPATAPSDGVITAATPRGGALSPHDVFDPRFRLACDLYNTGIAKCIAAAQKAGRLDPSRELHFPTPDGKGFTLHVSHTGFAWKPEDFGTLRLCEDYQVLGLANQYRTYGLGVPLIATRPRGKGHSYFANATSFPVTAFFRFEGGVADLGTVRTGRLELYNPLKVQSTQVANRRVPLETDLTTPLAYFLGNTDLQGVEYANFLRPDKFADKGGIQLLEPYQRGKIPVLLVHGLLSSPLTWMPLYNDLRADPELREKYQFWAYFYPTGNPFIVTAADLRDDLDRLRADLDPKHTDPALNRMVLVGHSMGGLISHLLTVDSGDDFWKLVSDKPFDSLQLQPKTREELRRLFFFQRRECIERVVFIGTPHGGSKLSPAVPGQIAAYFVKLPKTMLSAARDLAENPDLPPKLRAGRIPTSIDLLAPGSPALEALAHRPRPAGVHYHTIAGIAPSSTAVVERWLGGYDSGETDGVVPVSSARIDGAESERFVPADHYRVHHHPFAVIEVHRILNEHAREPVQRPPRE